MSDQTPRRLLVANRGEIVCRIARSARRLGWTTIAVYSDADRGAKHVRAADEAYYLGPSPAAQSYLDQARVIELACRVGADAVHPGYGFLSENADFAQACLDAGLAFVGPPPAAIRAMGSKSASKAAMAAVGVPVAPGYHGEEQSMQRLLVEAERVGFPLIIKASAGGGGKGMQVVNAASEVTNAVSSAQRLARTAFGDDRLLFERYFPVARHVEVQIFADGHGTTVALFDRDCSVQRRHQKIVEEAPAPGLSPVVRQAMSQAALTAARAVGYVGAGTVEFLVDPEQNFYFMEMNTRLQVEHPVTEMITGVDLVEWQLRIVRGEALPVEAQALAARGAAVEVRLYAEDPAHQYLPSVGRITHLEWPSGDVRLDVGVDAGDEVSSFYDPMLGKLITWAESREEACELLQRSLADLEISGVITNRALLSSVLADPDFRRGGVATNFLERRRARLAFGEPEPEAADHIVAAVWLASGGGELWSDRSGWRAGTPSRTRWRFGAQSVGLERDCAASDDARVVELERYGTTSYRARIGRRDQQQPSGSDDGVRPEVIQHELRILRRGGQQLELELDGRVLRARVIGVESSLEIYRDGRHSSLRAWRTEDALQATARADEGSLVTPLPGTIVAVHVSEGQAVERGAPLVTLEAMKMEHTVSAPQAGTVTRLPFGLGERVAAGSVLVELA